MSGEMVQGLAVGLVGIVTSVLVVQRWLKGTTAALDAIPSLASDSAEAIRSTKAAHSRLDVFASELNRHDGRLTRMETRWELHVGEHERSEQALSKRLDTIDAKLDRLIEGRD